MDKVSIIGCGWLGLPLAKFLVQKGFPVKGSVTTESKINQLASLGIKPFLINLLKISKLMKISLIQMFLL